MSISREPDGKRFTCSTYGAVSDGRGRRPLHEDRQTRKRRPPDTITRGGFFGSCAGGPLSPGDVGHRNPSDGQRWESHNHHLGVCTLAHLRRIAIGQCRRSNRPVVKLGGIRAISDGATAGPGGAAQGFGPRAVAAIGFSIVQVAKICFR